MSDGTASRTMAAGLTLAAWPMSRAPARERGLGLRCRRGGSPQHPVDWFREDRDLVRRGVSVVLHRQAPPRAGTGAVRPPGRGADPVEGVRARPARATATLGELPGTHRTEVRHLGGTG